MYSSLNVSENFFSGVSILLKSCLKFKVMMLDVGCGMRDAGRRMKNRKSQDESEEPSLLSDGIVMNTLSGVGLLDSVNCASSKQRLGVTRREPLA